MISLVIKQPGFIIQIPGTKETRTPSIIDITRADINVVIMYLKSMGITNYEILHTDKKKEKLIEKENIKSEKNINSDNIISSEKIDSLTNELSEIKKLLKNLTEKQTKNLIIDTTSEKYNKPSKKSKLLDEVEDIEFIPTINTDGLSSVGNLSVTTGKRSDDLDISESVNLLKSLKK